jgi:hypothetical protein
MDVTEHRTDEGKVYLGVVVDAWSRRVVGWSIADHMRSELVVDAVQMVIWRRRPPTGQCVAHSDHGRNPTAGRSGSDCERPGSSARWAASVTHTTTARLRASSPPCSSRSSTSTTGPPAASSPRRSSNGSSAGTTRPAGTHPDAQPPRRRSQPHPRRSRGMITTTKPFALPGQAHLTEGLL